MHKCTWWVQSFYLGAFPFKDCNRWRLNDDDDADQDIDDDDEEEEEDTDDDAQDAGLM